MSGTNPAGGPNETSGTCHQEPELVFSLGHMLLPSGSDSRLDVERSALSLPVVGTSKSKLNDMGASESMSTLRPKLPTTCSFSSSASSYDSASTISSSSSCSTSSSQLLCPSRPRSSQQRPALTPEALYAHAFGFDALERKQQRLKGDSSLQRGERSRRSSISSLSALSKMLGTVRESPPPPGTFKSVKPSKSRPVLVNVSARQNVTQDSSLTDESQITTSITPPRERLSEMSSDEDLRGCNMSPSQQREPLMSPADWRKKSSDRPRRRSMLFSAQRYPSPFNIEEDGKEFGILPSVGRKGDTSGTDMSLRTV